MSSAAKATGDISAVFPSLSGAVSPSLPARFADLKSKLSSGREQQLQESWRALLLVLKRETEEVKALGSAIIPEIDYWDLDDVEKRTRFRDSLHRRGVAIVRGVVAESEALGWKELLQRYIETNPTTRGFPPDRPAVYELYWAASQILARAHPNVLQAQAFLMSHWHSAQKSALISTSHPTSYADRLRIRQPGDTGFALGPHVDSGSCERWEEDGYGKGGVYNQIFQGNWQSYNPWEASCRLPVVSDLYNGAGACSMLRMFQGWLSMSETGPGEGTLMVNPLFSRATAYYLLRPFFSPRSHHTEAFLDPDNWTMDETPTLVFQGAVPSNCQELNATLHPHLDLEGTMVHIPSIRPGDYVAWHCDTIHAVDKIHAGKSDSSVMYIPACPLTVGNAEYLRRQREAFWEGAPGPDFPSGVGETQHVGRLTPDFVMQNITPEAQRAMGLAKYETGDRPGISSGERKMLERANEILGFA
ncbi:MAG: hypothetical protein Q9191_000041 [Dirinaria sp. TL-2023a]